MWSKVLVSFDLLEDLPLSLVVCQVGKLLYKQSSSTVKRLGLELGGNAAFLVFPTADLDLAVTILHLKIIQDSMTWLLEWMAESLHPG